MYWNSDPAEEITLQETLHFKQVEYLQGDSGEKKVCPREERHYVLKVYFSDGALESRELSIHIGGGPPASNISFTANPNPILRGQCATVRWDADNVRAVYYNGQGVTGHESRTECPSTTTTYTLRVVTHSGEDNRSITLTVSEPPTNPPPSTSTPIPPTNTRVPPTNTPVPPTNTFIPPTPVVLTVTPIPTADLPAIFTTTPTMVFQCGGFGKCPDPYAKADLALIRFWWDPAPEAFKTFALHLEVRNDGAQPYDASDGSFRVAVTVTRVLGENQTLYFDSRTSAKVNPNRLTALAPGATQTITLSDLTYPYGVQGGSVQVTIVGENDPNPQNDSLWQPLTIGGAQWDLLWTCANAVKGSVALIALYISGGQGGNTLASSDTLRQLTQQQIQDQADLSAQNIEYTLQVAPCMANNDNECLQEQTADFLLLNAQNPLDVLAGVIEKLFGFVKDIMTCSLEVFRFLLGVVSKFNAKSNTQLNLVGIMSPVNVVATNTQGQRLGILENGSIIQEISGARVVQAGEYKFLLYPGQDTAQLRVAGTGNGTFDLAFALARGNETTRVEYRAVPVNPHLVGTLNAQDPNFVLQLDPDGDGKNWQARAPDNVQRGGNSPVQPTSVVITPLTPATSTQSDNGALAIGLGIVILLVTGLGAFLFLSRANSSTAVRSSSDAPITIGRDPRATFVVSDTQVSRRHAQITRVSGVYVLSDLNSRNGTFVNGQRVTRRDLVNGDRIRIGKKEFLFQGGTLIETRGALSQVTHSRAETRATLIVKKGAARGAQYKLGAGVTRLGRGSSNDIALDDTVISRRHAEIVQQGAQFVLRDMSSANGIFVNGARTREKILRDGDEIRLGETILVFKE